ncbi:MAG: sulfotransferase, partial [bacterium]
MRFLIIGMQRSGTTLVGQVMNSHPGVSMFADELKVDPIFTQGIAIYGMGSIPSQDINAGYIKLFDAITHKHGASLWGAKVALQEPIQASKLVYIINNHLSDL